MVYIKSLISILITTLKIENKRINTLLELEMLNRN